LSKNHKRNVNGFQEKGFKRGGGGFPIKAKRIREKNDFQRRKKKKKQKKECTKGKEPK